MRTSLLIGVISRQPKGMVCGPDTIWDPRGPEALTCPSATPSGQGPPY